MKKRIMVVIDEEVIKGLRAYLVSQKGSTRGISQTVEQAIKEFLAMHASQPGPAPQPEAKPQVATPPPEINPPKPAQAKITYGTPMKPTTLAKLHETLQAVARRRGLPLATVHKATLEFLKNKRGHIYTSIEELCEEDAQFVLENIII